MFCESVKVCAHATVVTVVLDRWLKQALSTDDFGPIGEPKSVAVVVAAVLLWKGWKHRQDATKEWYPYGLGTPPRS